MPLSEDDIQTLILNGATEARAALRQVIEIRAHEAAQLERVATALERYAKAGERIADAAEKRK